MPTDDLQRFVELRSKPIGGDRNFEVPCTALIAGRCGIYPNRPKVCRDFEPGGQQCLSTVRARRTQEQYALIRGDADPSPETLYATPGR